MNWSNGFSLSIELSTAGGWPHAIAPGRIAWLIDRRTVCGATLVATRVDESWQLRLMNGSRFTARLERWWLIGSRAGLAWRGIEDGCRYSAWLSAAQLEPATWRRLRVRLRHPASIA